MNLIQTARQLILGGKSPGEVGSYLLHNTPKTVSLQEIDAAIDEALAADGLTIEPESSPTVEEPTDELEEKNLPEPDLPESAPSKPSRDDLINRLCELRRRASDNDSFFVDAIAYLKPFGFTADEEWELIQAAAAQILEQIKDSQPKRRHRKNGMASARRVSRAPEVWRHLKNYPGYEVSSHGRVRSLDRAHPDAFLKPRFNFFKGAWAVTVVIKNRDARRCEPQIGWLMVDAGFKPLPRSLASRVTVQ